MKNKQSQSGFTLIEILVVVAIVGLMGSVLSTMIGQSRVKARDTKRKAELIQLQKALEIYFNTNNNYPTTSGSWYAATGGCTTSANGYIPNLAPTYAALLPADPKPSTETCSGFNYRSDGSNYKIISTNVNGVGGPESFPPSGEQFYDPKRPGIAIMVTNNVGQTSTCPTTTAPTCW